MNLSNEKETPSWTKRVGVMLTLALSPFVLFWAAVHASKKDELVYSITDEEFRIRIMTKDELNQLRYTNDQLEGGKRE